MGKQWDVIIIGGGHNGLTAAAYLAKAGKKLLVLERRPILGGVAATEEVWPGYRFSPVEQQSRLIPGRIRRELELEKHGMQTLQAAAALFLPAYDGAGLLLPSGIKEASGALKALSAPDSEALPKFDLLIRDLTRVVRRLHALQLPAMDGRPEPHELLGLLKVMRSFRNLGEKRMWDALRIFPMRVVDLLDEWFRSEPLKAALALAGVRHEHTGVRSAGTSFSYLRQRLGARDGAFAVPETVRGGLGGLIGALVSIVKNRGGEFRTESEVARIQISKGKAVGVILADGTELSAPIVLSNADPKHTLSKLVDPLELDPEFLWLVGNIQMRGVTSKVNLALGELPEFRGRPGSGLAQHHQAVTVIADHPDRIERAYDAVKYGEASADPVLEVTIPSAWDPTLCPQGKHLMCIHVQYTPYRLRAGNWDERRDRLGDQVVEKLSEYVPNLKRSIIHRQVLTPLDLERIYGLTEGHVMHGECSLSQSFYMRPVEGWGRHGTPIENLYLCGSGTHPGGAVTCEPGRLAAIRVLKYHS